MKSKTIAACLITAGIVLSGCAVTSPIMDAGNGVYTLSANAAPIAGGATGATSIAFKKAQEFCGKMGEGLHPVVVERNERDIYQSSFGGNSGGTFAAGAVNFSFRCEA